jgi:hypothetical protein
MPQRRRGEDGLSSAILYGAIVIIWLCVLIPRWLRREQSSAAGSASDSEEREVPVVTEEHSDAPSVQRPHPSRRDAERTRVIGARRRLLGMLVLLAVGAVTLYTMQLAAWWVVIPPTVMLVGYLLLLREASRADAERAASGSAGAARARHAAPVPVPVPVTPEPAPAPEARIIDITARVTEEFYDQYADAKLRAVGD